MDKILILLSTYNGEKYLKEQIGSLFNQINCKVSLLVRDDGSTDSTLVILNDFKHKYLNKISIIKGNNIGWKKSFFKLLEIAHNQYKNFDYYAFCDQDDIWLPEKLSKAIDSLKADSNIPSLYCSNLIYYKDGTVGNIVRKSHCKPSFKNCLVYNYATGCTVVFNRTLLQVVCKEQPLIEVPHDFWMFQIACLCGMVHFDTDSYIYYRQHDNNQIGIKRGIVQKWKQRIRNITNSSTRNERYSQVKEIKRIHQSEFLYGASIAVDKFINYRKTLTGKFKLLFDPEYTTGNSTNDLFLRLKILFSTL